MLKPISGRAFGASFGLAALCVLSAINARAAANPSDYADAALLSAARTFADDRVKNDATVTLASIEGKQCYENYPESAAAQLGVFFPKLRFDIYRDSPTCASIGFPYSLGTYTFDTSVRAWATDAEAAAELCSIGLFTCPAVTPPPPGGTVNTVTVFEFYHAGLKHYFRTANASEAAGIDSGSAGAGWLRTGDNFKAYAGGSGPGFDVCRFYTFGANSHFYTADASECAGLKGPTTGWVFEGVSFRIATASNNTCPNGTIPVHRLYNNRFAQNDSNHRFTTKASELTPLQNQGWKYEGVAFCAPA